MELRFFKNISNTLSQDYKMEENDFTLWNREGVLAFMIAGFELKSWLNYLLAAGTRGCYLNSLNLICEMVILIFTSCSC